MATLHLSREGQMFIYPEQKVKGVKSSPKRLQRFTLSASLNFVDSNFIHVNFGISLASHKEDKYTYELGRRAAILRSIKLADIKKIDDLAKDSAHTATTNLMTLKNQIKKVTSYSELAKLLKNSETFETVEVKREKKSKVLNQNQLVLSTNNLFVYEAIEKEFDFIMGFVMKTGCVKKFLKEYTVELVPGSLKKFSEENF